MQSFSDIRKIAVERKGGTEKLEGLLCEHDYSKDISAVQDNRILSEFSKRVFQSGFNWSVIEKKWPEFEVAFHEFDIGRNALMFDEHFDAHMKNAGIVRHAKKILSVRDNAIFLSELAKEHGTAGSFFDNWPSSDLVGLWDVMKKRGSRLGGNTGQYALRFLGKDCFILSRSVLSALTRAGIVDGPTSSKKARRKIQEAFNSWKDESGESYTRISRVLAMSVND